MIASQAKIQHWKDFVNCHFSLVWTFDIYFYKISVNLLYCSQPQSNQKVMKVKVTKNGMHGLYDFTKYIIIIIIKSVCKSKYIDISNKSEC